MMRRMVALLVVMAWSGRAVAVPTFEQLYKKKYATQAVSCLLCHQGGAGGKLNDYGRDFFKAGAGLRGLAAVEGRDSDGDGVRNIDEIRAGSNAGDPASTPKKPGNWLMGTKLEDTVPLEDLQGLFPRAGRFEFQEVALTDADREAITRAAAAPLEPEELLTTLYFPVDTAATPPARTGVAMFGAVPYGEGILMAGMALAPSGQVTQAWANYFTPTGREALKDLARQVVGKSAESPLQGGKDLVFKGSKEHKKLSAAAALAFKKNLLIVTRALSAH
jgi:hypothetical protein